MAHLTQNKISDDSCRSIILDTIMESEVALTQKQLKDAICSLFHVLVTPERIDEILGKLSQDGVVCISDRGIVITPTALSELRIQKLQSTSTKKQAMCRWIENMRLTAEFSDEQETHFTSALSQFVDTVFIRHGVSSYNFICNPSNITDFSVSEIAHEIAAKYPDDCSDILTKHLPEIFQLTGEIEVFKYLIQSVQKAVGYISEVISDEITEVLTQSLKSLTLYLDTNTLYRMLNLQGEERFQSVSRAFEFFAANGIKLKVSAPTSKELSRRLNFDATVLKNHPSKVNLSELGYRYRTVDNYVSSYWRRSIECGISVDDYIKYNRNYDILLDKMNIEVEKYEISDDTFIENVRSIFTKLSLQDVRHEKSDNGLWHDAYNMAYVQSMQKADAKNVIDTGILFLTTDWSLLRIQSTDYELKMLPPISITPTKLLQLFSFSTPELDYEETFVRFFTSTTVGNREYTNDDIQEILSRISHYDDLDSDVAEKILCRTLIDDRYKSTTDDGEREEIVYNAISEELTGSLAIAKKRSSELETTNEMLVSQMEIQSAQYQQQFTQQKAEESEIAGNLKTATDKISELEDSNTKNASYAKKQEDYHVKKKYTYWKYRCYGLFAAGMVGIIFVVKEFVTQYFIDKSEPTPWLAIFVGLLALAVFMTGAGSKVFWPGAQSEVRKKLLEDYRDDVSCS